MTDSDLNDFITAVRQSWSVETSPRWQPENPARGECNVTSLVFNDRFGGEILKTPVGDQWHFYNHLDGKIYDLTADQFPVPPIYLNVPSSRAEALAGTLLKRYQTLARRVSENLPIK